MRKLTLIVMLATASIAAAQDKASTIQVSEADEPMEQGQFEPTWESLSNYKAPRWFRDAKFGIWAHWGPQCVSGTGDWMARGIYVEGSPQYNYHVEHYGHPSEVGFKDILPLFKAENWNPEALMALYKRVGAQFFVAMANHHDNFDLWDSKYQPWNSMRIGAKRDILGEWADAAKQQGLPFGISFHSDHAWRFYETAQRYDRSGKYMGVPYDGTLTLKDGKGKWWEGLDPQDLYAQNHELSQGSWADKMISRQWAWGNGATLPTEEYCTNFYNRTLDAINKYNPDYIYFDATVMPLYPISDAGLKIAAHFYNRNMRLNKGRLNAVMTGKILNKEQRKALVWDVEKGAPNYIVDEPWESGSCIGGWHYSTDIYEKSRYKSASTVIKLLADIVSKNGTLLLSVPMRADGTIDEKEEAVLNDIALWMDVNKEAIFGTRPWTVFGEGPVAAANVKMNKEGFNEGAYAKMGADEIRFTRKGKYLYAIVLGVPETKEIAIKSVSGKGVKVRSVELLGHGKVAFRQTSEGLKLTLPVAHSLRDALVFKMKCF